MKPPQTLNAQHECFAQALAAGHSPDLAYQQSGYHHKSRKSRAQALSEDPRILARVAELRSTTTLPSVARRAKDGRPRPFFTPPPPSDMLPA